MITQSLYQIDENILTRFNLPSLKRLPNYISYITDLLTPIQRLNGILSDDYLIGSTYPTYAYATYSTSFTYSLGERTIGSIGYNQAVFESVTASNYGNLLNDINYWEEITPNFIGINERVLYNGNKLTFEWALNHWFGGTFSQPPGTSSIYITDTIVQFPNFIWGAPGYDNLSYYGQHFSTGYILTGSYSFPSQNYTIHIPTQIYNRIPGTESGVRSFADKYNISPLIYSVVAY